MTLKPCDIIATGTPAGVGFAMKAKPKFLQDGDDIEIEIEDIGILRNKVVEKNPSPKGIFTDKFKAFHKTLVN